MSISLSSTTPAQLQKLRKSKTTRPIHNLIIDLVDDFNRKWQKPGNIGMHERDYLILLHTKIYDLLNVCWSHAIYKGDSYVLEHRSIFKTEIYPVNQPILTKESLFKKAHRE
jgi:hypothetical protein